MQEVKVEFLQNIPNSEYYPFTISLPESAKLIDLKKVIHAKWKLHPKQQQLSYHSDPLEDDQKLILAYEIMPDDPVLVDLESASILLVVVCPNGEKVRVNDVDLNLKAEAIKEQASQGLANKLNLKASLRLFFGEEEVEWNSQFRAIVGLEDGSELSTGIRLRVAYPPEKLARCPRVDLNWTVKEFKDRLKFLTPHQRNSAKFTFKGTELLGNMILRDVANLDSDETVQCGLEEKGGSLV